ncbi:MAG: hypothetical protein MUE73_04300 [Planctomycetes bacterium]|jgi:hypothetical protein|nr:hypothetical protein [Planctomycetota bacterium]
MNSIAMLVLVGVVVAGFLVAVYVGTRKRDKAYDGWPAAAKKLGLSRRPFGFLTGPRISGRLDGHRVAVTVAESRDGDSRVARTIYAVRFARAAGQNFDVNRTSFRAAGRAGVEGLPAEANAKLRDLFKGYPEARVTGREIRVELLGVSTGPEIMAALHAFTAFASTL